MRAQNSEGELRAPDDFNSYMNIYDYFLHAKYKENQSV